MATGQVFPSKQTLITNVQGLVRFNNDGETTSEKIQEIVLSTIETLYAKIEEVEAESGDEITVEAATQALGVDVTNSILTIAQASTSISGLLSSSDWNTFNDKSDSDTSIISSSFDTNTGIVTFTKNDPAASTLTLDLSFLLTAGGSSNYSGSNPTISIGGLTAGVDVQGDTLSELIEKIIAPFVIPSFLSFTLTGGSTLEINETLTGSQTFSWTTEEPSNILPNTIQIEDITGATVLGTGLVNDGTEDLALNVVNSSVSTNTWRITGTDTQNNTFSRNVTKSWRTKAYFGTGVVNTSAEIKANDNTFIVGSGGDFDIIIPANTPDVYVAIPSGTSFSAAYIESANADVTSTFTSSSVSLDINGTNVTYDLYKTTIGGGGYPSQATYKITL